MNQLNQQFEVSNFETACEVCMAIPLLLCLRAAGLFLNRNNTTRTTAPFSFSDFYKPLVEYDLFFFLVYTKSF